MDRTSIEQLLIDNKFEITTIGSTTWASKRTDKESLILEFADLDGEKIGGLVSIISACQKVHAPQRFHLYTLLSAYFPEFQFSLDASLYELFFLPLHVLLDFAVVSLPTVYGIVFGLPLGSFLLALALAVAFAYLHREWVVNEYVESTNKDFIRIERDCYELIHKYGLQR